MRWIFACLDDPVNDLNVKTNLVDWFREAVDISNENAKEAKGTMLEEQYPREAKSIEHISDVLESIFKNQIIAKG